VNAEFNMVEGGPLYPANFALKHREQLEYTLPSFTIGEAATATLLLPHEPDNFQFTFHSKPELADLCTIPVSGYESFCRPGDGVGKLGIDQFTAFGSQLHEHLDRELPKVLKSTGINIDDVDIVFVHTSSKTEWQRYGEGSGIGEKIYHAYGEVGNVVSASIPAAMALGKTERRLRRSDRVLCWMGSAGMSFSTNNFIF